MAYRKGFIVNVFNILISGVGGQGVLLTSKIIAEAALLSGLDVKQSEVHGMAQRGGSVLSQVRFGEKVFSPIVSEGEADLLIGFEPLETARYLHFLRNDGAVIYNTRAIGTIGVSIAAETYPSDINDTIRLKAKSVMPMTVPSSLSKPATSARSTSCSWVRRSNFFRSKNQSSSTRSRIPCPRKSAK